MIAISAEGGMRDAESLLGQIISLEDKNITLKEVEEILGTADKKTAEIIAEMIFKKNSSGAISKINELLENGYDLEVFNKSLINYLRQLMIIKIDSNLKKYFSSEMTSERLEKMEELSKGAELSIIISSINLFLEAQSKISSFILPQLPLEIAIIKATQTFPTKKIEYEIETPKIPLPPSGEGARRADEGETSLDKKNISSNKTEKKEDSKLLITNCKLQEDNVNTNIDLSTIKSNWQKLLIDIRPYNHSLSALLSNCQPTKTEKNIITLGTPYSFYCERLNDKTNRLTVEQVFSKILKSEIKINIELDKNLVLKKEAEPIKKSEQNSLLTDALEIMGGKVVEE